jgi:hypothetical protein
MMMAFVWQAQSRRSCRSGERADRQGHRRVGGPARWSRVLGAGHAGQGHHRETVRLPHSRDLAKLQDPAID